MVPELVLELAANCVRFVQTSVGVPLDFSNETLPLLDHYATQVRGEIAERPEVEPLLSRAIAAYFGQVLAAEFSGFWRAATPDAEDWLVCLQPVFLAVSPLGITSQILSAADAYPGPSAELMLARSDRELVEGRLAALPEVREDDYYTFSTRFDAIQVAVAALKEQLEDGGMGDIAYELGDYQDELGEI